MIHLTRFFKILLVAIIAILPFTADAQTDNADNKDWVIKSNEYTKILLDIDKKYSPEFGSSQGLAVYDTLITIPTLNNQAAQRKETEDTVLLLKDAKSKEANLFIKQDLDILINQAELGFRNEDFGLNKKVSFLNATGGVFQGLQILLDDQTAEERRNAAVQATPSVRRSP